MLELFLKLLETHRLPVRAADATALHAPPRAAVAQPTKITIHADGRLKSISGPKF